jgi:hypothetical protein
LSICFCIAARKAGFAEELFVVAGGVKAGAASVACWNIAAWAKTVALGEGTGCTAELRAEAAELSDVDVCREFDVAVAAESDGWAACKGEAVTIEGFGDVGLDLLGKILFSLSLILGREGIVEAIISLTVKTQC